LEWHRIGHCCSNLRNIRWQEGKLPCQSHVKKGQLVAIYFLELFFNNISQLLYFGLKVFLDLLHRFLDGFLNVLDCILNSFRNGFHETTAAAVGVFPRQVVGLRAPFKIDARNAAGSLIVAVGTTTTGSEKCVSLIWRPSSSVAVVPHDDDECFQSELVCIRFFLRRTEETTAFNGRTSFSAKMWRSETLGEFGVILVPRRRAVNSLPARAPRGVS
jgi:hypothetical protein